jgi:hypothetical protein
MPEEKITTPMHHRPEQYEDTVNAKNPPVSTGVAPAVVAGMWYYLAPVGIIILAIAFALVYWGNRDAYVEEPVAPTTGQEQVLPGGRNPDPKPESTEDEIRFRGER